MPVAPSYTRAQGTRVRSVGFRESLPPLPPLPPLLPLLLLPLLLSGFDCGRVMAQLSQGLARFVTDSSYVLRKLLVAVSVLDWASDGWSGEGGGGEWRELELEARGERRDTPF